MGGYLYLCISAATSEFCEWVQVGIDVYIPHRKYQVKPHSSPWFSAAFAVAIIHRNHFFFVCINRINLLKLKKSSDKLVIVVKGLLKLPNLYMQEITFFICTNRMNLLNLK